MMNGMLATLPHVQSGKLKVLAVSKRTRMPLIGEVPTIAEQGVPGFESGTWQGMLVPKGTPDAVVQQAQRRTDRRDPQRRRARAPGRPGRRGGDDDAGGAGPVLRARAQALGPGGGPGQRQAGVIPRKASRMWKWSSWNWSSSEGSSAIGTQRASSASSLPAISGRMRSPSSK